MINQVYCIIKQLPGKSRNSYQTKVRDFIAFQTLASLPVTNPVPSDQVIRFLFYLKDKGLAAHSFSVYLAALLFWAKAQGWPDFISDFRIKK